MAAVHPAVASRLAAALRVLATLHFVTHRAIAAQPLLVHAGKHRHGGVDGRNPVADLERCYLHYIGRSYWAVAEKHGLLEGPLRSEAICPFAVHYQFFRELLLAVEHDGVFVLLSDARSPVFYQGGPHGARGLLPAVTAMLPQALRERVVRLTPFRTCSAR